MQQHSPASTFEINGSPARPACVLGVDIGGTNLRLALADMAGTILARTTRSTLGIRDAHEIVSLISASADALLAELQTDRTALCAIAAAAPGITDPHLGIVIATSYLLGWVNVPLRALLEAEFHIPVAIENDVNAAALGEYRAGSACHVPDFVFLAIGTGLGAGILVHGELLRGHTFTAGEIGYLLVPGAIETPIPPTEPGALEQIVGGEGIKAHWQALWNPNRTSLPINAHPTEIFDAAQLADPLARQLLDSTARTLTYAIFNICLVLNCPLIVFGGGVGLHPALIEATRTHLEQRGDRVRPRLIPSTLGADAQLIGAIHLALDAAIASL